MKKAYGLFIVMVFALVPQPGFAISEQSFFEDYESRVVPFYRTGSFGELEGTGGVRLSYAAFEQDNETGALVILHGKSESYIKYAELVYDLRDTGLSCYLLDQRGFGFSERIAQDDPEKVYVERFDDYVADLRLFIDTVVRQRPHTKVFLLAHSLGGCVAARYLETYPGDITAAVLCSPMLQINTGAYSPAAAFAIASAGTALGKGAEYAPGQGPRGEQTFYANIVTHSFVRWKLWEEMLIPQNPQIRSGGATYNWVRESMAAGFRARQEAGRISTPLLVLQAEEELMVRPEGMDELCDRAPDCTKVLMHDARHEILMETDAVRDIALWNIRSFLESLLE